MDLRDERVITSEMGRGFAEQYNLVAYLETSALSGQNVEEAFQLLAKSSIQ
ncbi:MAG: hypothetical protein ACFFCK_09765 [Promethearchaeota archaeon]